MSMPLDLMLSLVFACANNWWREMMEAKKRQRREGSKSARDVVAIFVPLCFYFWMDACVCLCVCSRCRGKSCREYAESIDSFFFQF
jgi:hypothetical protein